MKSQDIHPIDPKEEPIIENQMLSIWEALIPVFFLVALLSFNVVKGFGDDALSGRRI